MKTQFRSEVQLRQDREQQLRDFIRDGVRTATAGSAKIRVLARAPESMVARILFEMSGEIAARGLSAEIVFAGAAVVQAGDSWQLAFDPALAHEIRLAREPRLLDGHEQLVIGDGHVWFGDSMRREGDKRDAFASFANGDLGAGRRATATYLRIWAAAEIVYSHRSVESGAMRHAGVPAGSPKVPEIAAANAGVVVVASADGLPAGAAETLGAWQPSTRH